MSVEIEHESGQSRCFRFILLLGKGSGSELNFSASEDIAKFPIEADDLFLRKRPLHSNNEQLARESKRVVIAVKTDDFLDGFVGIMGEHNELEVLRIDHFLAKQGFFGELTPLVPVMALWRINTNDGAGLCFSGLDQSQILETLVVSPKPPGKKNGRVGFFKENQLAGEKILEVNQLGILCHHGVRLLFKGEPDVHPETFRWAGPLVSGIHDPRGAPGNHHPALLGHFTGELLGLTVKGTCFRGPCGSKHRDLAKVTVGREDLEGVTELFERGIDDFEIAPVHLFIPKAKDGRHHLLEKFFLPRPACFINEVRDQLVEFRSTRRIPSQSISFKLSLELGGLAPPSREQFRPGATCLPCVFV